MFVMVLINKILSLLNMNRFILIKQIDFMKEKTLLAEDFEKVEL